MKKFIASHVLEGVAIGVVGVVLGVAYVFVPSFLKTQHALAGAGQNISGWAWSEGIGWVSFNSTSDGSGVSYGVNVDTTNQLSGGSGSFTGDAWSETVGWISFNPAEWGACPPSGPCTNAQINWSNGAVTGWARALSNGDGWDGWVNLSQSGVTMNTTTGAFSGWAWGGGDGGAVAGVIGWLSFSSVTDGAATPHGVYGPGVPSGSLSFTAASCLIGVNQSTCPVFVNWNIVNAASPNAYNQTTGVQVAGPIGNNVSFTLNNGSNSFYARDGSTNLAGPFTATASCSAGLSWQGGMCVNPPSATLSVSPASCSIALNASTCAVQFTWNISNPTGLPALYNQTSGATYSNAASGNGISYAILYGVNTIQAKDGPTVLATANPSPTADCTLGLMWNGSICINPPVVINSFTSNPPSVPSGSASLLTWSTTNATNCTASGSWGGNKATSGSQSTGPLAAGPYTYTLTCTGLGNPSSASVTVNATSVCGNGTCELIENPLTCPLDCKTTVKQF